MGCSNGINIIVLLPESAGIDFEWFGWLSQEISAKDQVFLLTSSYVNGISELKRIYGEWKLIDDPALCIRDQLREDCNILVIKDGILLMPDGIGKLERLLRRRSDLGTLSPIFTDDARLPYDLYGLETYIELENQKLECVYISGLAIAPFFNTLKFSDFSADGLPSVFSKINQLGFQHALTDEVAAYSNHISDSSDVRSDVRQNLKLQQTLRNGRRNLLYLVQADFREDASNNIGGTQLHVKDLVFDSRNTYNVFVAARNREFIQVTAYLPGERMTFQYYAGPPPRYPMQYDEKEVKIFKNILMGFRIHLIHIHHTYSMSNEIYRIADAMEIPVLLTLHDFYYLCPTIKMFNHENSCCIGRETSDMCKTCLNKTMGIDPTIDYLGEWRRKNKLLLSVCSRLIVPSENAKRVFQMYNPEIASKIQVIEHGYEALSIEQNIQNANILEYENFSYNIEKINDKDGYCIAIEGWAYLSGKDNNTARIFLETVDSSGKHVFIPAYKHEREDVARGDKRYLRTGFHAFIPRKQLAGGDVQLRPVVRFNDAFYSCGRYECIRYLPDQLDRLNVAFIGGLSAAKGSKEICDIIAQGPKDVNWFIFGGIDDEQLANLKRKNLTKTNFYQRDELSYYLDLHRIDVVCILSLWPETFCYTLSEAIAYRRPVIVTDIGALGDRTRAMNCGWTVPLDHIATHVLKIINQIKDKGEIFQAKKAIANRLTWKSLNEMNGEYRALYSQWINTKENNKLEYNSQLFYSAWLRAQQDIEKSDGADASHINYRNYIAQLETEINRIKASRSFQLATIISKMWNKWKVKSG